MLLQPRGAGFLHQSCVASQGLGLTSRLWRPASINSEISLLAATRYGVTLKPVWLAQCFLDECLWKHFLWVDLWYRGKHDGMTCRLGNIPSPTATPLHPRCSVWWAWLSLLCPFREGVCLKSFVCSHRKVYHKCSPFAENEWVLKLPVSRAGLNTDACTHLHPLLCKPEVMSYTWLPWKNKVQSKNAFPTESSFTFCEYFLVLSRDRRMNYYFATVVSEDLQAGCSWLCDTSYLPSAFLVTATN